MSNLYAQRTVNVDPGFGTLNAAILGDTTAAGLPVDTNTVYLLQKGGLYILDGELANKFRVSLAATGSGERPRIILGVPSGGTTPDQAIRPYANFYAKGLYISAKDELGGSGLRIIRAQASGIHVEINDCVLDIAGQAAYRIDAKNSSFIIKNSIVSNIGSMTSPDNGRVFDDRGNAIDSLIAVNNTFYNITSKVIRDGGGVINYAKFDHNTMVNIGQKGCEIGEANTIVFTNNLFVNPVFIGTANVAVTALTLKAATTQGVTQTAVIRNNNIFTDSGLINAYPDSVKLATAFDSISTAFITAGGWASTNISEALTFTNGPATPVASIQAYWADPSGTQVELDTAGHEQFNFAYANSYASFSGSMSGQPLGAVNWFGQTLGVGSSNSNFIPELYSLSQNFPNPFNPETQISFTLSHSAPVRLAIYNSLGQEIKVLVNDVRSSGTNSVRWNGTNDAGQKVGSGFYFYRLSSDRFTETRKMLLIK